MAWPDNLSNVRCIGFNSLILPAIIDAIECGQVEWGECNIFLDQCDGKFQWKNCDWVLREIRELVFSISLKGGVLDDPDLTAAVLRG